MTCVILQLLSLQIANFVQQDILYCHVNILLNYNVCFRCKDSVKHFNVTWMGDGYKFGMGLYATLKEFIDHFDNQPLIAGESGNEMFNL